MAVIPQELTDKLQKAEEDRSAVKKAERLCELRREDLAAAQRLLEEARQAALAALTASTKSAVDFLDAAKQHFGL